MAEHTPLPVEAIRAEFIERLAQGPVVLTAPTGSGKSTQAPRWCGETGRVLVIEPRRVACRGLAMRVAELEGTPLGEEVGYSVRDDSRTRPTTRIVFATPGVVLRWMARGDLPAFSTVIIDEFHERSLDVDLLLALLADRFRGSLAVMSATMDGDRVARHLGGVHLHAAGMMFPVAVRHLPGRQSDSGETAPSRRRSRRRGPERGSTTRSTSFLPDVRGIEDRVVYAVDSARDDPGDILVFLPGKGEIARTAQKLAGRRDLEVLQIHGGLTLDEQARIFKPGKLRRVILSTNVAETSITVPGIGVVVDSGLVRRTRYHGGRGFLALSPIAMDSANQRAGRAGRLAPGICCRLWRSEAILAETTPPEIHREALTPLVLASTAVEAVLEKLPFLDPPKAYAVDAARADLRSLCAIEPDGLISEIGRRLFLLPLDPPLGAMLLAAERTGALNDMIDLVSALSVGRPLFRTASRPSEEKHDLRISGCDAIAFIRVIREGDPETHGLNRYALQEALAMRKRLRKRFSERQEPGDWRSIDRKRLALTVLAADLRAAYVARRRKRSVAWSSGGTEIKLSPGSAVNPEKTEAMVVLETQAMGITACKRAIFVTCALPAPSAWLVEAGIGTEEVLGAKVDDGVALARVGRVYAGKTLSAEERVPTGELARKTVAGLFMGGRLFPRTLARTRDRLDAARLHAGVQAAGLLPATLVEVEENPWQGALPSPEQWVLDRLDELGVESGDDLQLLSDSDLLAPDLPPATREWLDRKFPRTLDVGDGLYRVLYDLYARKVTLDKTDGGRKIPPALTLLPAFSGFAITVKHHSRTWILR